MNAPAACYHFSIFIGSFLYQRAKPPQGTILFINPHLMGSWWSTHPTETTFVDLLRVEEMQRADWMICLVWIQDGGICCDDDDEK